MIPSTGCHNLRLQKRRCSATRKPMSEADRVFPYQEGEGTPSSSTVKRLILSAPRRSGFGAGKSRVVEVVHVQRGKSRPVANGSRPVAWNVRAETWPEGFRAKSSVPP